MQEHDGNWALVMGAAEGVGKGFSEVLASRGINLIMVDYNQPALDMLSNAIRDKFNIKTITCCRICLSPTPGIIANKPWKALIAVYWSMWLPLVWSGPFCR